MANETAAVVGEPKLAERRTMINLTKGQYEWIRRTAFEANRSISAVIRAAIDAAMEADKTG